MTELSELYHMAIRPQVRGTREGVGGGCAPSRNELRTFCILNINLYANF